MSETPYGTIWARGTRPYGTLGSIRQHPTLGDVNEGRVMHDGRPAGVGEVGRARAAQPGRDAGLLGDARGDGAGALADGWLRTGDLVTADADGTYTFVGRNKEVIRRRGENVAPAEVEAALADHPDVVEAAVVGVPSELSEEEIKAFVVLRADADLAAVRAHAAGAARAVQGAALHGGGRRAAAHADRPRRQARAAARAHGGRDRLREESMSTSDWLRTEIGATTADSITIRGRDLAGELMGRVTFTELAFLLVQGRMPAAGETTLLDAVLVSLADHGLTPTVLAARLTYTGAPESLQGAVAAGLLGAGSVFLGVVEDAAVFLARDRRAPGGTATTTCARRPTRRSRPGARPAAASPGSATRCTRSRIRARRACTRSPRRRAARAAPARAAHGGRGGRGSSRAGALPINGAGAAGAALADLGFAPAIVRGFALLARTAGVVAHLAEEMAQPLGMPLFRELDRRLAGEDA